VNRVILAESQGVTRGPGGCRIDRDYGAASGGETPWEGGSEPWEAAQTRAQLSANRNMTSIQNSQPSSNTNKLLRVERHLYLRILDKWSFGFYFALL